MDLLSLLLLVISALLCTHAQESARFQESVDSLNTNTFEDDTRTCERIRVPRCMNMGYNFTGTPTFIEHESQTESEQMLVTFDPLVNSRCSSQLESFLCSAFVPMCSTKVQQLIGPCRPVCENVKTRCLPILRKFGFSWPTALNCSIFPERNTEQHMCMEFPQEAGPPTQEIKTTKFSKQSRNTPAPVIKTPLETCKMMKNPSAYKLVNYTGECKARCDRDNIFTRESKDLAQVIMAVCSALCLVSSTLTVVTFWLNTSSYQYPERPIIFLSLCYAVYSLGYLVRLIAGREQVTCDSNRVMSEGLDNTNCAAVFLLLYYFGTAAAVWWVILGLTWLLSAGLRWSHEAIELYSSYFHLVAWAIPAIQSIAIIVLRDVSSEELTGLCFVGNTNPQSLLGFVIGPTAAYLLLGTGFLVAGFIVLFCHDKQEAMKSNDRIETIMVRIGVFSVLYTVPATCLIACYFYEYLNLPPWYLSDGPNVPSPEIYMLKIIASLLPGIASGTCILASIKTLDTWSSLCQRSCNRNKKPSAKKCSHQTARPYVPVQTINAQRQPVSSSRVYGGKYHHHHHLDAEQHQHCLAAEQTHV